jgi:hypothetical protein
LRGVLVFQATHIGSHRRSCERKAIRGIGCVSGG